MDNLVDDNIRMNVLVSGKGDRYRKLYCRGDWFNDVEYVEFIYNPSFLLVRKCFLEIPKRAIKIPNGKGGFDFDMVSKLPLGLLSLDVEDSTEDELVLYYE